MTATLAGPDATELLRDTAARAPLRVAYSTEAGERLTFGTWDAKSDEVVTELREVGSSANRRPEGVSEALIALMGARRAGVEGPPPMSPGPHNGGRGLRWDGRIGATNGLLGHGAELGAEPGPPGRCLIAGWVTPEAVPQLALTLLSPLTPIGVHVLDSFAPEPFLTVVEREEVTMTVLTAGMAAALTNCRWQDFDLTSMRTVEVGPVGAETRGALAVIFPNARLET